MPESRRSRGTKHGETGDLEHESPNQSKPEAEAVNQTTSSKNLDFVQRGLPSAWLQGLHRRTRLVLRLSKSVVQGRDCLQLRFPHPQVSVRRNDLYLGLLARMAYGCSVRHDFAGTPGTRIQCPLSGLPEGAATKPAATAINENLDTSTRLLTTSTTCMWKRKHTSKAPELSASPPPSPPSPAPGLMVLIRDFPSVRLPPPAPARRKRRAPKARIARAHRDVHNPQAHCKGLQGL